MFGCHIKKKVKFCFVILATIFFLFGKGVYAADKVEYIKNRTNTFNVNVVGSLDKKSKNPEYRAGDKIQANISLQNVGQYCLGEGVLTYDLVKGDRQPNVYGAVGSKSVLNDNIIEEKFISTRSCPGQNEVIPILIELPKDLSAGQYRLDVYLNTQRVPVSGNHTTYSPEVFLPFTVVGDGKFPSAQIVRESTRFAGGAFQVGPVVELSDDETGFITLQNFTDKDFIGRLKVKVCTFGESTDSSCQNFKDYEVNIDPNISKAINISLSTNLKPDVYSINYTLVDENDRIRSIYKNRFIVKGHKASLRYISTNKDQFKKGDVVSLHASVNGPYTYNVQSGSIKDVSLKVDLYDTSGFFEKKLFSKTQKYSEVLSDSEGEFLESFTATSNITSYKLCGEVLVGGVLTDKRCIQSLKNVSFLSWPWGFVILVLIIFFVLLFIFKKKIGHNNASLLILITGFFIGFSIFFQSENRVLAAQYPFVLHRPNGISQFTNASATHGANCAYINFYFDKNNDGIPQQSEQTSLFTGRDDGLYYIPQNTIAYLIRPVFDDPHNDVVVHNTSSGHDIVGLNVTSQYANCIPSSNSVCTNGNRILYEWPIYSMSVTSNTIPDPVISTVHTVNLTASALLSAINANTHTDQDTSTTTNISAISPIISSADVPDLATLNSTADLDLLDSYIGSGAKTSTPYPAAKVFSNFKTRCEAASSQAMAPNNQSVKNVAALDSMVEEISTKIGSYFSSLVLPPSLNTVEKNNNLAAVVPSGCTTAMSSNSASYSNQYATTCFSSNLNIYVKVFSFTANAGDTVSITESSYYGTKFDIVNSAGTVLQTSQNTSSGLVSSSISNYAIPSAGTYYIEIGTYFNSGQQNFSMTYSKTTGSPPSGTPDVWSAVAGQGNIVVKWWNSFGSPSPGYKLYRRTIDANVTSTDTLVNTFASSFDPTGGYTDSTATLGNTTYYYGAQAYNVVGTLWGSVRSVLSRPLSPTALTAIPGDSKVTLNWTAPVGGAGGYKLYRRTTDSNVTTSDTLVSSTIIAGTSYIDTSAANGTTYYYKVLANNASGDSALNTTAASVTPAPAPGTPINLRVLTADGSLGLYWATSTAVQTSGYKIYRYLTQDTGTTPVIKTVSAVLPTNATDTPLVNGVTYYYKITAYNSLGVESNPSDWITGTPQYLYGCVQNITALPFNIAGSLSSTDCKSKQKTSAYADYYSISTTPNGFIQQLDIQAPATFDNYLYLTNSSNQQITYNDDDSTFTYTPSSNTHGSRIIFNPTTTAPYFIQNTSFSNSPVTGNYNLNITSKNCPTQVLFAGDIKVNTLSSSSCLSANYPLNIFPPARAYADYYVFNGNANDQATVSMSFKNSPGSALVNLIDPNGNRVAYGALSGSTSTLSYRLPTSGTYIIEATTNTANQVGPYTIAIVFPPTTPANLTIVPKNNELDLSWSASVGATGYKVYKNNSSTAFVTTSSLSTVDTSVVNGTSYSYKVSAYNAAGESPQSAAVAATPVAAPAAPSGFSVSYLLDGRVQIGLVAPPNSTGYRLYRSSTPNVSISTATLVGDYSTTVSYIYDSGLLSGRTYYYRESAYNTAGETLASADVSITTIQPPTNLVAQPLDGGASISWSAPTAAVSGYNIYQWSCVGSTCSKLLVPAGSITYVNQTNANISGLTNGSSYYFTVAGYVSTGEGVVSAQSQTIVPRLPTPTGLAVTVKDSALQLDWSAVAGATGYVITRTQGTNSTTITTGTNSLLDSGLTNGTTYYYSIVAVRGSEQSLSTSQISGAPAFYCSVTLDTTSEAQTIVTVSGKKYYVDLDGVRAWLWQNGYIYGTTVVNPTQTPAGTTVYAADVLSYKFKQSGVYNLSIHQNGGFTGYTYDKQFFSNRMPQ